MAAMNRYRKDILNRAIKFSLTDCPVCLEAAMGVVDDMPHREFYMHCANCGFEYTEESFYKSDGNVGYRLVGGSVRYDTPPRDGMPTREGRP